MNSLGIVADQQGPQFPTFRREHRKPGPDDRWILWDPVEGSHFFFPTYEAVTKALQDSVSEFEADPIEYKLVLEQFHIAYLQAYIEVQESAEQETTLQIVKDLQSLGTKVLKFPGKMFKRAKIVIRELAG